MPRMAAFIIVWCLSLATWIAAGVYLAKAVRRAAPGTPWLTKTNPLSALFNPDIWPPESRRYWRLHYVSVAVFLALCALGSFLAYSWPSG